MSEGEVKTTQTTSWDSVPDTWFCPGCLRRKPDCEVPSKAGVMLRCLFEHHDHMRDYVKAYLVQTHGDWHSVGSSRPHPREFFQFIDLIKLLVQRFPYTLVCIDCNEAEAKIKKSIGADKYFSFHPVELHRAIIPEKNQRHFFVTENMPFYEQLYEKSQARLVDRRKQVVRSLVNAAVSGDAWWGGPIQMEKLFLRRPWVGSFIPLIRRPGSKERLRKESPSTVARLGTPPKTRSFAKCSQRAQTWNRLPEASAERPPACASGWRSSEYRKPVAVRLHECPQPSHNQAAVRPVWKSLRVPGLRKSHGRGFRNCDGRDLPHPRRFEGRSAL